MKSSTRPMVKPWVELDDSKESTSSFGKCAGTYTINMAIMRFFGETYPNFAGV